MALRNAILLRGMLLGTLWLVLSGFAPSGLVIGLPAVAAAIGLSVRLLPPATGRRPWWALPLIPGFIWRSLLGGLDVARRALDPRMPLSPGWRTLPRGLPAGGSFLIGTQYSLMPGTLVAGTRQGQYLVHLLDDRQALEPPLRRDEARLERALSPDRS
ncbi:Na+/H+ antiporter subunit E [Spiribacter vilamensis]|uniref:Multisubunit sodium/proton antiporter MrpE subunit n=1 Tax=Spiribacter vilamensis TaxID=531306 RepID=A0A4Q8D2X8_9GAMM|nr:Na+/H+ antiporter subunit E [Spiribacter vilamensis]RZU99733.1 multisubunit sodium/proton antiporter MrpE subunit [Spiribacter vilamensis]TVO61321.1 hypothetical protein FPL09_04050 [Spiribacter vilamensis]